MSGIHAGSSREPASDQEAQEVAARLRERAGRAPVGELVAEAASGLLSLAYMRLGLPRGNEPYRNLEAARTLIDAVGGMLEATSGRLGQAEQPLREALTYTRLAYVDVAGASGQPGTSQPAKEPPPTGQGQDPGPGGGAASRLWVPGRE